MVAMEKLSSIKKGVNVVFPFSTKHKTAAIEKLPSIKKIGYVLVFLFSAQCLDSSTSLGTFTFGGMLC